jgi:hypothetical protein
MISRAGGRLVFLSFLFFCLAVLPVGADGDLEVPDPEREWGPGDPGGGGVIIHEGLAYSLEESGQIGGAPLRHVWRCVEKDINQVNYHMAANAVLQLGDLRTECEEDKEDANCSLPCNYGSFLQGQAPCEVPVDEANGAQFEVVGNIHSPVPLVNVRLDVCYHAEEFDEEAFLFMRIADTENSPAIYFDEEQAVIMDSTATLPSCEENFARHSFYLLFLSAGSYNIQLSIWDEACIQEELRVGGETENWVLRVGFTGAGCYDPLVALQRYDPSNPNPGPPDGSCTD